MADLVRDGTVTGAGRGGFERRLGIILVASLGAGRLPLAACGRGAATLLLIRAVATVQSAQPSGREGVRSAA